MRYVCSLVYQQCKYIYMYVCNELKLWSIILGSVTKKIPDQCMYTIVCTTHG